MDLQRKAKKKVKKKKKKAVKVIPAGLVGVVGASCRGCHIAHHDSLPVSWPVFGFEPFDPDDFGIGAEDDVPDMTIDEDGVLSVINSSRSRRKSFYISTSCACFDAAGMPLAQADFVDSEGRKGKCSTLVLTLGPMSVLAVCRVQGSDFFSHVSELPDEDLSLITTPPRVVGFPLSGEGPFLCSQGRGGQLSHFGVQRYAVDLECPPGTLVVAVGDGEVLEVRDSETCSGPHAENLFHWNSVLLQLAGGPVVE